MNEYIKKEKRSSHNRRKEKSCKQRMYHARLRGRENKKQKRFCNNEKTMNPTVCFDIYSEIKEGKFSYYQFGMEGKFSYYQFEKVPTVEATLVSDISPPPLIRVVDALGLCTSQNETMKIDAETVVTTLQIKKIAR